MNTVSAFVLSLVGFGEIVANSAFALSGEASGTGQTFSYPQEKTVATIFDPTYGFRKCRLVRNTSGATLTPKLVCIFKSGSSTEVLKATAAVLHANKIAGVVPETLYSKVGGVAADTWPDGYWGWLIYNGDCKVISGAAITANDTLSTSSGTAGYVQTNAAAAAADYMGVIGTALEAAGGAGEFSVFRLCLAD